MSPPRVGLLQLLISGITIKITTYLLSRELEVDLSRSDINDHVGSVEERSSNIIGVSSSSPMSRTMKSARENRSCILTITTFAIPSENRIDWSTIYNCIYVGNQGSSPNKYSYVTLDIILTPDPML